MKIPFDRSCLRSALERMDIADIAQATIRQSGDIARTMERDTGVEFLHLEMGVPGLPPERAGVEAECAALQAGVASQYPNMFGIPELKTQASRFLIEPPWSTHGGEVCNPPENSGLPLND